MNVTIYSDGGVRGNGKEGSVGAYGAVLMIEEKGYYKDVSNGFIDVTNNQMELQGAIQSLKVLKHPCKVTLYTDSSYVVNGMNKWIEGWIKNNWISSSKKPVKNKELWQELLSLTKIHKVEFKWVRGHADNIWNNRADKLCNLEMDKMEAKQSEKHNKNIKRN